MNVSIGLVALWLAFCLAAVGVKGKGKDLQGAGSEQFNSISLGATLVQLLRGNWPYDVTTVPGFGGAPGTVVPNPNYNPNLPYGGGTQTSPEAPSTIVPVDPNQPSIPNFPQAALPGLPAAGSVNL